MIGIRRLLEATVARLGIGEEGGIFESDGYLIRIWSFVKVYHIFLEHDGGPRLVERRTTPEFVKRSNRVRTTTLTTMGLFDLSAMGDGS